MVSYVLTCVDGATDIWSCHWGSRKKPPRRGGARASSWPEWRRSLLSSLVLPVVDSKGKSRNRFKQSFFFVFFKLVISSSSVGVTRVCVLARIYAD